MTGRLSRLGLPGDDKAWTALGFGVGEAGFRIGEIHCTIGAGPSWGFDGTSADPGILGVPELLAEPSPHAAPTAHRDHTAGTPTAGHTPHPNAVTFVDHVVYWVPDLDEAVQSLNAVLGAEPRRRFHPRGPAGPEMAFYRAGPAVIEVAASGKPASLPGIAFGTTDLDATVAAIRTTGGPVGDARPAVQGGRIASVWHGHLDCGIAFYQPPPR